MDTGLSGAALYCNLAKTDAIDAEVIALFAQKIGGRWLRRKPAPDPFGKCSGGYDTNGDPGFSHVEMPIIVTNRRAESDPVGEFPAGFPRV